MIRSNDARLEKGGGVKSIATNDREGAKDDTTIP